LNAAVAELNRTVEAAVAASKDETLRQVAEQMEKLARQTNAALATISRKGGDAAAPEAFGQNFPKEGIPYTVQKGDSIGSIARKTGAKAKDIIDANKIADPSKIMAGQALFIPGGK
jgi:LysM repeat protein